MDRTFETIESVAFPSHNYFESLVIIVSAGLTFGHINVLRIVSIYRAKADVR
jgi:hypothetical protein